MINRFFGPLTDASFHLTSLMIIFDCALWTWNVTAIIRAVQLLR